MDKIRIGLIGAGNIAQNAHIPAYLNQKDVELVAVCDFNKARADEVKEKYGMKHASYSIEEVANWDDVDAVSVCTWNNAHAEAVIAAAKAGKHILCEKPMAMTVEQTLEMEKAVKANGKVYLQGFVSRLSPEAQAVKAAVEEGALGDIYYARCTSTRRRGTPIGWFHNRAKSGGGPVIDIGVHVLDMTWYLMGKPRPVSVTACAHYDKIGNFKTKGVSRWTAFDADEPVFDTEDSANGLIRFENGLSLSFDVSWAFNGIASEGHHAWLYGTKAGATVHPCALYGETAGFLSDVELKPGNYNMFDKEIRHFLDCIYGKETPISPIEDGIAIQRILNGIYESAEKGCEVKL